MIYKKTASLGQFLKKGTDYKDGDIVTIANEGKQVEGKFGTQKIFLVKLSDGKEGNIAMNTTSINNAVDAFGEDAVKWVGKEMKIWLILQNVQGKMIKVTYLSHPDSVIDEDGNFSLGEKKTSVEEEVDPISF